MDIDQDYHQIVKTPELDVVRVVCLDKRGRVLLVQEVDDVNWKLTGGKIHAGETIYQALIREVEEELGVAIDENMIKNYLPTNIPDSENIRHIFLLEGLEPEMIKQTEEVKEAKFFSLDSLPETKFAGHIKSAVKLVS